MPATLTDTRPTQSSTQLQIKRLGVFLGAEITGIDLTRPLDSDSVEQLKRAHAEHGVLVFRPLFRAAERASVLHQCRREP